MSIPRQRRRVFRWDYDKEKLQKAIEVVVAGVMTSRQAAEVYGVPRSTVYKAAVFSLFVLKIAFLSGYCSHSCIFKVLNIGTF
jgi:hypothetical protein